jgi:hypothetical protein
MVLRADPTPRKDSMADQDPKASQCAATSKTTGNRAPTRLGVTRGGYVQDGAGDDPRAGAQERAEEAQADIEVVAGELTAADALFLRRRSPGGRRDC